MIRNFIHTHRKQILINTAIIGGHILLISMCLLLFTSLGEVAETFTPSGPFGELQIQVLDGMSETPIENAMLVIPETDQRLYTQADGKIPPVRVPIIEDQHFAGILKKSWGEVTLIVYKEGYVPYVLFHTQIWENERRQGPKILLFKDDGSTKDQPFSVVEGPQRLWVNELINRYIKVK